MRQTPLGSKLPRRATRTSRDRDAGRGLWSNADLAEVESAMVRLTAGSRLEKLGVIAQEHLATGGRRFRARLALGVVEALGGRRSDGIAWAAACELLHNATLVHDDLQDGDEIRRGHPAVWARHGVEQAINVGDLMLMLPYRVISEVPVSDDMRWHLAHALAVHAEAVVRGQAAEQDLLPARRLSWDEYSRASEGKTAALFSLPVFGAALIAGLSVDSARELADAFRPLGVLFQMQDDVLDLYGDKGRAIVGSDLYEGKVSALIVEHLRLHPEDEEWVLDLLQTPREHTLPREVDAAIARFRDSGALDGVWARLVSLESNIASTPCLKQRPKIASVAQDLVAEALRPIVHTSSSLRRGGM